MAEVQSTPPMVKTYESRILHAPNLDKVAVSFDKLNITDLFHQIHEVYLVHLFCIGTYKIKITITLVNCLQPIYLGYLALD